MSHDEFRGECDLHAALSLPFVYGALALGATIKFNCLNGKVGHKLVHTPRSECLGIPHTPLANLEN